jgi:SAM-dependent methyltransferase
MSWNNGYVADLQYPAWFFPNQGPVHLDFACVLNGVEPVALDKPFTYFELGFGQGLTVNLLAASNPQGRFYAADFNPAQVAAAQQLAADAQLDNLVLLENSFAELADGDVDLPQFDFVTMHGVYSWVNAEARKQIVRFLARYLKPGGIVYTSYNAMPGWASALPLQRLLLEHQMYPGGTDAQLKEARRLVDALEQVQAAYFTDNASSMLKGRLDSIRSDKSGYLAHEYMSRGWDALYHIDVARQLADAKLDYACSARLPAAFPHLCFTDEQQKLLEDVDDAGLQETLKDYIRNASFREDIFVRGARRMTPKRRMHWLRQFGLASVVMREKASGEFRLPNGEPADAAVYDAVLDMLETGPKSLAELAELPQFAATGMAGVTEVAAMLISRSHAAPWFLHRAHAEAGPAHRANRCIAERARDENLYQNLASPLLGSAVLAGHAQRLVYRVMCAQPDGIDQEVLVDAVWESIGQQQSSSVADTGDGKPIDMDRENDDPTVRKFLMLHVPIWRALKML